MQIVRIPSKIRNFKAFEALNGVLAQARASGLMNYLPGVCFRFRAGACYNGSRAGRRHWFEGVVLLASRCSIMSLGNL